MILIKRNKSLIKKYLKLFLRKAATELINKKNTMK